MSILLRPQDKRELLDILQALCRRYLYQGLTPENARLVEAHFATLDRFGDYDLQFHFETVDPFLETRINLILTRKVSDGSRPNN